MAFMGSVRVCPVCQHHYNPIYNAGVESGCPLCLQAEEERKEKEHMEWLETLTDEERLQRIEKWIYNYKAPRPPGSIY